jgi:hypothetical protein
MVAASGTARGGERAEGRRRGLFQEGAHSL